ncbi:MAG: glycosyltransferase family 4 protein [Anaerolineae bacterium]|nr:glycosyltransferase family 4 protein [Anaerolineae bacterium]MDW8173693.1 glycosyltransferase family 4 protein [Anaerolineae bacterium]
MHLGILAPDLNPAHGWGSYSLNVIRALRAAGLRLTILSAHGSLAHDDIDQLAMLPTLNAPQGGRFLANSLAALPQARRLLASCDALHALAEPYALLGAALAGQRPLFVTGHGSYVNLPRLGKLAALYRWAFSQARLLCVSEYTAQVARSVLPRSRIQVVLNGVQADRLLALTPAPDPNPLVLAVGAVKRRKGALEWVRGLAQACESLPSLRGLWIGTLNDEPRTAEQAQAECERLGISQAITWAGRVPYDDLLMAYQRAWVFALPSMADGWKFEGFGLAHLEASAAALPVIGTRESGIASAIEDGVTGLLLSQARLAQELPTALLTLLSDEALRVKMGARGRVKAASRPWSVVAQELIAAYAR